MLREIPLYVLVIAIVFLPLMFTAADPGIIKGGAPVYGVGICAPQKLKHSAGQYILNGLDHTAFYVDYTLIKSCIE